MPDLHPQKKPAAPLRGTAAKGLSWRYLCRRSPPKHESHSTSEGSGEPDFGGGIDTIPISLFPSLWSLMLTDSIVVRLVFPKPRPNSLHALCDSVNWPLYLLATRSLDFLLAAAPSRWAQVRGTMAARLRAENLFRFTRKVSAEKRIDGIEDGA